MGRRIMGYARVSTKKQLEGHSLDEQERKLKEEGCTEVIKEQYTGTKTDRPEFSKLIRSLKSGDTLIVTKLDRFARSCKEGMAIMEELLERGIVVRILNFGGLEGGFTSNNKLMFQIFLAFAEFERDLIVERTQEGRKIAMEQGVKMGRTKLDTPILNHAIELFETTDMSLKQVCEATGVSKATLCRRLKEKRERELEVC